MPKGTTLDQPLRGLPLHLVMAGALTEEKAREALIAASEGDIPFVLYLVKNEILDSDQIVKIAASDFGVPLFDLDAFEVELIPINLISEEMVRKHHALPIYNSASNQLYIAVSDPTNLSALYEFKFNTGLNTHPILVEEPKLSALIEKIIGAQEASALGEASADILEKIEVVEDAQELIGEMGDEQTKDDAPIIRFINRLLLDAINKGASDIHFEPYETTFRVRFRQDGILYEIMDLPTNLRYRIAARIKVMAKLDSTEHRLPQDGHFKWRFSKTHIIDFRVSICPMIHGEKVVIRVLDPGSTLFVIDELGLSKAQNELLSKTIQRSQGMILVTGPTGSGKTVTLYTLLSILNTIEKNTSTAEDPVEIELKGINQVNVNPKAGLDFATILRSFLRQDPDIIMVGEMRDLETADIGIKAAQTGHLVLATLHTNSAPDTLSRLLNMGVPSYNVGNSVVLIIAQRLLRKLCDECKKKISIPKEALIVEGFKEDEIEHLTLYGPVGCEKCLGGYKGRIGVFETLPISNELSKIIMAGGTATDIETQAVKEGMLSLREGALEKVREGVTSLDEVNRVVSGEV